jgi:hypothetical protein
MATNGLALAARVASPLVRSEVGRVRSDSLVPAAQRVPAQTKRRPADENRGNVQVKSRWKKVGRTLLRIVLILAIIYVFLALVLYFILINLRF